MYIYGVTRKGNKGTGKLTKDEYLRSDKKGKEGNRIIDQGFIFKECQEKEKKETG